MEDNANARGPAASVERFLLRYIIPFQTESCPEDDQSFEAVRSRLSGAEWEPIVEFDDQEYLYDHIISSLRADCGDSPLGCAVRWRGPDAGRLRIAMRERGKNASGWNAANISLVLFTTGIGFLWFDLRQLEDTGRHLGKMSLEALLRLQQQMGNLVWRERQYLIADCDGEGRLFGAWIRDFLEERIGPVRFFWSHEIDGKQVPRRALRFAYAILDREESIPLHIRTCQLARGLNTPSVPGRNSVGEYLENFKGTCFHISREGCAYIASPSAPEYNLRQFPHRFTTCYFWIYMLILQQAYGMKAFARRISECTSEDPYAHTEAMDRLLMEISSFLVRNEFPSISDVHHINEFYLYGLARLNIREESALLHDSLNAMTQLQNSQRQTEETTREKTTSDRLESALALLSLLTVISAMCDSVGFITGIRDEHMRGGWWILAAAEWLGVVGIVVFAVFLFRGRDLMSEIRSRRKERKALSGTVQPRDGRTDEKTGGETVRNGGERPRARGGPAGKTKS